MQTRGFVTIATGDEKYYILAQNLLRTYRKCMADDTPFSIICDRENQFTDSFDQVILMDQANCSYMDKLLLYRYTPYYETIFIDADSLILSDPSGLWEDFADADDVSCYGCAYPLDSDRAWFTYEGTGKYKEDINFLIDLHGGIYYIRKTPRSKEIFEKAIELAGEYKQYSFKNFVDPADEPVLAMSLAIHQSVPCSRPARLLFVPSHWGQLSVSPEGEVFIKGEKRNCEILHFGTANTERFVYRYIVDMFSDNIRRGVTTDPVLLRYLHMKLITMPTVFMVN